MATLAEVVQALATGQLTSRAYVDNLLGRIRAREDRVRAWAHIDAPRVRALADRCDEARRAKQRLGPLHGLPIGIKDVIDTQDVPTEYGSPIFAGHRPTRDADIVARLRRAGAFVFGKTTTTEFAFLQPAETRNPWNPMHSPGGSSSGSAAAIAAGFVHAALGTQTNGSVIRPAAYCGIVGFKPTFGLLPLGGVRLFSATMDTIGTLTRTVGDGVFLVSHLVDSGLPPRLEPLRDRPTLGAIVQYPWTSLEPEARAHFEATLATLAAGGAKIVTKTLPVAFLSVPQVHRTLMLHEAARLLRDVQDEHRARFSATLNRALDEGRTYSSATYGEMLARRAALIEASAELFTDVDAIVSPPASGTAPRIDSTGDPGFCTLWSLVGFPALSIPSGLASNGLPFGIQIVARAGNDDRLMRIGQWIESIVGKVTLRE